MKAKISRTFYLDETIVRRLQRESDERGMSQGEIVRRALLAQFNRFDGATKRSESAQ